MRASLITAAVSSLFATSGLAAEVEDRPRIVVEGSGTAKSPPNVATLEYKIRGEGKSSDDSVKSLVAIGARVESRLRSIDPEIEPQADGIRITAVRAQACKEDDEDKPQLSTGSCAIVGYLATQGITARTQRVADSGTMIGLAGRAGATDPRIRSFELLDDKPAKRAAIAAALADARTKAEAIAAASGVTLGAMMSASLDGAYSDSAIVVTGSRRRMPPQAERDDEPVTVSLTPELIQTRTQVTVSYAIR